MHNLANPGARFTLFAASGTFLGDRRFSLTSVRSALLGPRQAGAATTPGDFLPYASARAGRWPARPRTSRNLAGVSQK